MTALIHARLFDMLGNFFQDRVTITRETPGSEDALGGPGSPTTTTVLEEAPCRFMAKTEKIVADDKTQALVVTRYVIDLPLASAANLRQRDTVSLIRRADGSSLANAFRIESMLNYRDTKQQYSVLELERIS